MEKEQMQEIVGGLSREGLEKLDDLFNQEVTDGLQIFATLFALSDEDFELLRPIILDSMLDTYNDPQVQMQLVQALAQSGLSINDVINYTDEVADQLFKGIELSEPKKDFFKMMFATVANAISTSTINPAHVVEIPVEICREGARLPAYATNGSGAMDIYNIEEVTLRPGECKIVPIGIKVAIPHGYGLLIQPRSGLSRKIKLRIPNSPGLIDEDYHEEIGVIVENITPPLLDMDESIDSKLYGSDITIGTSERFAQMRLVEIPRVRWREVTSLGAQAEDHGAGFGSTGVN